MDNTLDFIDGPEAADTTVTVPTPAAATGDTPPATVTEQTDAPAVQGGPARDAAGKFISKGQDAAPAAPQAQAPATPPEAAPLQAQPDPAKPPEGSFPSRPFSRPGRK
jgi:hypothetical protein